MAISFSKTEDRAITFRSGPPLVVICPACGHEKTVGIAGLRWIPGEPFSYNAECPACSHEWTEKLILAVTLEVAPAMLDKGDQEA